MQTRIQTRIQSSSAQQGDRVGYACQDERTCNSSDGFARIHLPCWPLHRTLSSHVQDAKAKQEEVVTERACSTKETHLLDLPDLAAAQPCGVHMETVSATPSAVVQGRSGVTARFSFSLFFRNIELKRTTREPRFHELVSTRWDGELEHAAVLISCDRGFTRRSRCTCF